MAEPEGQEEPPETEAVPPRYDDAGRLLTTETGSILPTEWVGDARTVDGEHHYEAVSIGWEGSAQYTVSIGDCVYLTPDQNGKGWCEVGQVTDLFLAIKGELAGDKVCAIRWMYRKSQVVGASNRGVHSRELLYSDVIDDNMVESIEGLVAVLFYTDRKAAGTRLNEPHTFYCHRTYDPDEQSIGKLERPLPPPPPPPPTPPPPQRETTSPQVQLPSDTTPMQTDGGVSSVAEAAAPAPALNTVEGTGADKRGRKSTTGSRTTISSLESRLQHALEEIELLKRQMTQLQSMVVCIQSSSGSTSERSGVSTCASGVPLSASDNE